MKAINTSTFDFPGIIQNDFLYIDKTAYIWNLVRPKKGEYFLSRPRRFGKSLLVSTLKAFFQGRKKLFQGLAIAHEKVKWQAYPVIHLDLANSRMKTAEDVEKWCLDALDNASKQLGIPLRGRSYAMQFENLIRDAADGSRHLFHLLFYFF